MGTKYPVVSPDAIIKVPGKIGFQKTSQKGSHVKYKKPGIHHWYYCLSLNVKTFLTSSQMNNVIGYEGKKQRTVE